MKWKSIAILEDLPTTLPNKESLTSEHQRRVEIKDLQSLVDRISSKTKSIKIRPNRPSEDQPDLYQEKIISRD